MIAKPNAVPVYDTSANILAATVADYAPGTIFVATDAKSAWIVRYDTILAANYLEPLVTWDGFLYSTPTTADLYVETTGSDSNNGLTIGTAFATIDKAQTVAGRLSAKKVFIHVGAGTFDQPVCTTSGGSVYFDFPPLAGGIGRTDCEPIIMQGTVADQAGARTQLATAAGTAPTYTTITDTAGGFAVSAFKGMWIRYTSGAVSGKCILIQDNTANVITLDFFGNTGAANGDTYVIEDCATKIRWNAATGQTINWTSSGVLLDSLEFNFAGGGNMSVSLQGVGGSITRSRFRSPADGTTLNLVVRSGMWTFGINSGQWPSETLFKPRGGLSGAGGVHFDSGSSSGSVTFAAPMGGVASQCVYKGFNIFVLSPGITFSTFFLGGSIQVGSSGGATGALVLNGRIDGSVGLGVTIAGVTYRGVISAIRRASVTIQSVDISNTTNATDPVLAALGSQVKFNLVFSGAGNTGVPVHAVYFSDVQMDDPGGTQNCTGAVAGQEVTVGANAVTTYANIAAGAAANISDYAAVSPHYCVVRK